MGDHANARTARAILFAREGAAGERPDAEDL
jgi:hypothetical protein